jgi:hypothetical protein
MEADSKGRKNIARLTVNVNRVRKALAKSWSVKPLAPKY